MHDQSLSHVSDSLPPITGARQVPLSMGLPRQDTGLGCHFLLQCFFTGVTYIGSWVLYHCGDGDGNPL